MEQLAGVEAVVSGYGGGHVDEPTYEQVCAGTTGHAEVVQVTYDPDVVSYEELLAVFFTVHDPTTLNRQGPDVGEQYRSIVLYHDDDQREKVEAYVETLAAEGTYDDAIVTEIEPLETFYRAEDKHQDYYAKNPSDAYCSYHAQPKIEKVRERFPEKVRRQDA